MNPDEETATTTAMTTLDDSMSADEETSNATATATATAIAVPQMNTIRDMLDPNAKIFIPRYKVVKRYLTFDEAVQAQAQTNRPKLSNRCNYWPHCSNKNCKYTHPVK